MSKGQSNKKFEERVQELDSAYLDCRDYGHSWVTKAAERVRNPDIRFKRHAECSRCGTSRSEFVDNDGDIVHRQYGYADGYQMKGYGTRTLRRGPYRLEHLDRWLGKRKGRSQ